MPMEEIVKEIHQYREQKLATEDTEDTEKDRN